MQQKSSTKHPQKRSNKTGNTPAPNRTQEGGEGREQAKGAAPDDGANRSQTDCTSSAENLPAAAQNADLEGKTACANNRTGATPSTTEAFFLEKWPVPKPVLDHIGDLLSGWGGDAERVWKHVYACCNMQTYEEEGRWTPVPWTLIRRDAPKAEGETLDAMCEKGLLERKGYDRAKNLCREYRVPQRILDAIAEVQEDSYLRKTRYNLFDGKRLYRCRTTSLHDKQGNAYPEVIAEAMQEIDRGRIDAEAAQRVVEQRKKIAEEHERQMWRCLRCFGNFAGQPPIFEDARAAQARWRSDLTVLQHTWGQDASEVGEGVIEFKHRYRPQRFGRISDVGSLMQNASGAMKAAAYSYGAYNYDIESSQTFILQNALQQAGIECDWFDLDGDYKTRKTEAVGIDRTTWKRCEHAIKFGATIEAHPRRSVYGYILGDVGEAKARETLERFREEVAPLYEAIQDWHEWLVGEWLPRKKYAAGRGWYVRHEGLGLSIRVDDKEGDELKKALAALHLQAPEAYFIKTLTRIVSAECGIDVISDEHDGLVTRREIPQEAVQAAQAETGMHWIRLARKPFEAEIKPCPYDFPTWEERVQELIEKDKELRRPDEQRDGWFERTMAQTSQEEIEAYCSPDHHPYEYMHMAD